MSRVSHRLPYGQGRAAHRGSYDRRRRPVVEALEGRRLLTLDFASAFGVGGAIKALGFALDAQGDTYVTGEFTGKVIFDPNSSGSDVRTTGAAETAFVAKYSPTNAFDGVVVFGPQNAGSSSVGTGLAVDNNTGSVYAVGNFSGTVNFGTNGNIQDLTSSLGGDAFVVKLTSSGAESAVKQFGVSVGLGGSGTARAVTLNSTGTNVSITGTFTNMADFDLGGTDTTLTSFAANESDSYALALSNSLGFEFAARVGVAEMSVLPGLFGSIATDGQGNVYVTGVENPSPATSNAFIAKFNGVGSLVSERLLGGPASGGTFAIGTGVATDSAGNVYVSGVFSGTGINFDKSLGAGTDALDTAGGDDAFLIKLDPSFDLLWARRFGSVNDDGASGLAVDASNNVYLTGSEDGVCSFGTTGPGTQVLATGNGMSGTANGFVLEVDSNGNFVQATGAGGIGSSGAIGIAVNGAGEVAIGGTYVAPATFGGTTLQALGADQFFVATLTSNNGGGGGGGGGAANPPKLVAEAPLSTGKGKHKKIIGFELVFSSALDASTAANVAHYQVTQPVKKGKTTAIKVKAATYNPANDSVALTLGTFKTKKPLQMTATGLTYAGGTALAPVVATL